jgi:AraC-like DNA-binding protein
VGFDEGIPHANNSALSMLSIQFADVKLVDWPEGQNGGLMLAQQAGIYRERAVSLPLRDHFSCVWVNRLTKSNGMPFVVVPDGTIDLQCIDGRWRVAGPDRKPMIEQFPARTVVVGFRFQPGGSPGWLGPAASEFCGQRVWLEDVWGRVGREADAATGELGPNPSIAALEGVLSRWAASKPFPNAEMMSVYQLLSESSPSERHVVPWLMAELGLCERTLRRRFEAAFGYGPKTLHRILRFQRYLNCGGGFAPNLIGRRAAASGYADQSHLVRECRRLALCTPSQLP